MASRRAPGDSRRSVGTARLLRQAGATRGEAKARLEDDVIRLNMSVAIDVARRYYGRGIPVDDINQVAFLGLVKAVRGFDPTIGGDFLSYAVPTLRGEIRRYFRDSGWTIRPPRSVQEVQARVVAAEAMLTQRLGRAPQPSEIAVHLEVPLPLVVDAMAARGCFTPMSLDASRADEGGRESPTDQMGGLDPAFASAEARLALAPVMATLNERDRRILELRYFDHRTQAQIGDEVGVSQEQISRLLSNILRKLRRQLAS
ncbi:MAG: sigma-70 family RNA polymerase sigma factor [Nocardioides sp.]